MVVRFDGISDPPLTSLFGFDPSLIRALRHSPSYLFLDEIRHLIGARNDAD